MEFLINVTTSISAKDAPDMARFDWEDPFLLEDQLTEDERMLRDAARSFAEAELAPKVIAAYRDETVDPGMFKAMGSAGLLGLTIPEEYGGLGASYVTYGLVAREIERVDSGYRSMMSVQSSLVMYPIYAYGSEEQRQKYLPGLAAGDLIGCFGLTEPDAGSDPAGMKTVAKKTDNGYVLNGAKMWISNAPFAPSPRPMAAKYVASFWRKALTGSQRPRSAASCPCGPPPPVKS